jgi:chromosome segregation ATPase
MSATTTAVLADLDEFEHEMLERLDERSERLDRWVEEIGSPTVIELRDEFTRGRAREEREWALTRTTISRSLRSSDRLEEAAIRLEERLGPLDGTMDRLQGTLGRVERALDENTQTLRSLRDSLEGEGNGSGSEPS